MRNRLAGVLPDVTSKRGSRLRTQFDRSAERRRVQIEGWARETPARSARTRRSCRSLRGGLTEDAVQGFGYGLGCNERVECRVDSVKHSTSPSRRENARRAISSQVFSKSVCRYRTSASSALRRRVTSVCRLQHVRALHVPSRCCVRRVSCFSCPERRERHAEKF